MLWYLPFHLRAFAFQLASICILTSQQLTTQISIDPALELEFSPAATAKTSVSLQMDTAGLVANDVRWGKYYPWICVRILVFEPLLACFKVSLSLILLFISETGRPAKRCDDVVSLWCGHRLPCNRSCHCQWIFDCHSHCGGTYQYGHYRSISSELCSD